MASGHKDGLGRDLTDMLMGGTSAMFATLFTNPIEVVKTRLQLQGELRKQGSHAVHYRGVLHAVYVVGRTEGLAALQKGLPAMMGFQFCLNTFRLGTYRICERRGLTQRADGKTSVLKGALAAGVGGVLGSIAGTPFYLVKTRLQSQGAKAIAVGHQHTHTGLLDAFKAICKKEGFKGLFRGVSPQIPRGAVGSGSQMVSFAYAKEWLVEQQVTTSPLLLSFLGSCLGGVVMTWCLNPFDVVATRLSNQPVDANHRGKLYSSMADCFVKMFRHEGLLSFYKGVVANYMRLGPHTVLLLICWDQLKILEDFLRSFHGNWHKLYFGMTDCFVKMFRHEGLLSFYKGVVANYMRLGPHTVLLLVCWDQLKILEDFLRSFHGNWHKLYFGMTDCFVKMFRHEGLLSFYKGVVANYLRLGPHTVLLLVCWNQLKVLEDFLRS